MGWALIARQEIMQNYDEKSSRKLPLCRSRKREDYIKKDFKESMRMRAGLSSFRALSNGRLRYKRKRRVS
jgi:hypothetical protein